MPAAAATSSRATSGRARRGAFNTPMSMSSVRSPKRSISSRTKEKSSSFVSSAPRRAIVFATGLGSRASGHVPAAGDVDRLTGHEHRQIGQKEQDRADDVALVNVAANWRRLREIDEILLAMKRGDEIRHALTNDAAGTNR